jgi:hypothetical protein
MAMLNRVIFFVIALFWLVMNFLLWRSEFGGHTAIGGAMPVEAVWQKILTAPDNSSMEILHHKQKIGFCRLSPNVGQERSTGKISSEEYEPEGRVKKLAGYSLDLDGNVFVAAMDNRYRFDVALRFTTNQAWREISLRVNQRPDLWEIHANAAEQSLRIHTDVAGREWERVFTFVDLRNPDKLVRELGGPFGWALLGTLGSTIGAPLQQTNLAPVSLGLKWEARNDWLKVGSSKVRVYRLRARLMDRFQIVVYVSRTGEILRIELPDDLVLANDALLGLLPLRND